MRAYEFIRFLNYIFPIPSSSRDGRFLKKTSKIVSLSFSRQHFKFIHILLFQAEYKFEKSKIGREVRLKLFLKYLLKISDL